MKLKNNGYFKISAISISAIILICSGAVNSAYASAVCPTNTEWDGYNCISNEIDNTITSDSDASKNKNHDSESKQGMTFTGSANQIFSDLAVTKSEIKEIQNKKGVALEQKMSHSNQKTMNLTRENFYFKDVREWSTKNAESTLNIMVNGKDIQNPDFGKNNYKQIEYGEQFQRSEDPVLQNQIMYEKNIAEKTFLKLWGNFTNH